LSRPEDITTTKDETVRTLYRQVGKILERPSARPCEFNIPLKFQKSTTSPANEIVSPCAGATIIPLNARNPKTPSRAAAFTQVPAIPTEGEDAAAG